MQPIDDNNIVVFVAMLFTESMQQRVTFVSMTVTSVIVPTGFSICNFTLNLVQLPVFTQHGVILCQLPEVVLGENSAQFAHYVSFYRLTSEGNLLIYQSNNLF